MRSLSVHQLQARFDDHGGVVFRVRTAAGRTRKFWLLQSRRPDQSGTFFGGASTVACEGLEKDSNYASLWLAPNISMTAHYRSRVALRRCAQTAPLFAATLANLQPFLSYVRRDTPALRYTWYRIVDLCGTKIESDAAARLANQLEDSWN